jgi:GT2 family glycosyltransferase
MRVLGHIHTYNEGRVIDRSLAALLGQTHPVDEVLLVDNASTDDTLDRVHRKRVKVVRFEDNRMTSDPVICAMEHALTNGYDWVWILNGDTAPRPECLAKLLEFFRSLDAPVQDRVWLLAALPVDVTTGKRDHGFRVTSKGLRRIQPESDDSPYECDATIWSGSLYRVAALREVGLPRSDYAMDMAEIEFGYRGRQRGYRAFVHQSSILDHNIAGPSLETVRFGFGPLSLNLIDLKPFRCYYVVRNVLHFWIYVYRDRSIRSHAYCFAKVGKLMLSFLLRPFTHRRQIQACVRGLKDGLSQKLSYRYPV